MAIFYVYLKWDRESNKASTDRGRYLLICESRYVADELFRALQIAIDRNARLRFTTLDRRTPQMWFFDSIDAYPWNSITTVLCEKYFMTNFGSRVITQTLPCASGRVGQEIPIIPASEGPDWVHGGAYYIRNKRRPGQYWYHVNGDIHISNTEMSKFRIHGVGFPEKERKVLIRSDRIVICPVENISAIGSVGREPGSNRLVVSETQSIWGFGDFVDGFKGSWGWKGGSQQFVTWAGDGCGDEWELC